MKTLAVCCLLALSALPALAGPRDDVYAGSVRCANVTDDRAWLDCYYGAAQPMRSKLGLAPAPQSRSVPPAGPAGAGPGYTQRPAAVATASPPPMPESGSSLGHLFGKTKPIVNNLRMASYGFDGEGYFTVTLEDGEVWRQSRNPGNMAAWKLPASSYLVTILPGVIGSYDMKVRGVNGYFKVRRIS